MIKAKKIENTFKSTCIRWQDYYAIIKIFNIQLKSDDIQKIYICQGILNFIGDLKAFFIKLV